MNTTHRLAENIKNNTDKVRKIYEYVRDEISHSFDINANNVTCRASEAEPKNLFHYQ